MYKYNRFGKTGKTANKKISDWNRRETSVTP